jgi:hypothetical protein
MVVLVLEVMSEQSCSLAPNTPADDLILTEVTRAAEVTVLKHVGHDILAGQSGEDHVVVSLVNKPDLNCPAGSNTSASRLSLAQEMKIL